MERPEVLRHLLGGYRGAFSLGVTQVPGVGAALLLQVEGDPPADLPSSVKVDDEYVSVIVRGGFAKPRTLGRAAAE